MTSRAFVPITILITCVALGTAAASPAAERPRWTAAEVVTSYVSGTSPTYILGLDNNLEICLALREARSAGDLAAEVTHLTQSQLVLLRVWHLVERLDDGRLRCTLPIIEPPRSGAIEARARLVASAILRDVGSQIETYLGTVSSAGWPDHRFTLLGSFVLDGLVWRAFEALGAIDSADPTTLPSGSDFWSGVSWITLPPREVRLGTNSFDTEQGTLYTAWTPPALKRQAALETPGLREALVAAAGGAEAPRGSLAELRELGLLGDSGARIPVIHAGDPLCLAGGALAGRIARALLAAPDLQELLRLTGASAPSIQVIMAYHWVYPDLLEQLRAGGLEAPGVLAGQEAAALAPALYVVAPATDCVTTDR